jgi:cytoskeletal protein RodZ
MKLDRFRAPALAAAAVLMISGAGTVTAHQAPGNPAPASVAPVTVTTPAPTDTDLLQQGDQTTPDTSIAPGQVAAPEATEQPGAEATSSPESATASEVPETTSDGPGGHQDPAGQNVDHQFDGQE